MLARARAPLPRSRCHPRCSPRLICGAAGSVTVLGKPVEQATLQQQLRYAVLSGLAYEDDKAKVLEQLKELDPELSAVAPDGVPMLLDLKVMRSAVPLTRLGMIKTDTEVLALLLSTGEAILAWRGTELSGLSLVSDFFTDIAFGMLPLGRMVGIPSNATDDDGAKVHYGFLTAFNGSVKPHPKGDDVADILRTMSKQFNTPIKTITCTGHSLGGALATLAAYWVRRVAFPDLPVTCCTFGSPRVGNDDFRDAFLALMSSSHRYVHNQDVVPTMPPFPNYQHVDKPVLLFQPANEPFDAPVTPKTVSSPEDYAALYWKRPRGSFYFSKDDHDMQRYHEAIRNVLAQAGISTSGSWALSPSAAAAQRDSATSTMLATMGVGLKATDGQMDKAEVQALSDLQPANAGAETTAKEGPTATTK